VHVQHPKLPLLAINSKFISCLDSKLIPKQPDFWTRVEPICKGTGTLSDHYQHMCTQSILIPKVPGVKDQTPYWLSDWWRQSVQ